MKTELFDINSLICSMIMLEMIKKIEQTAKLIFVILSLIWSVLSDLAYCRTSAFMQYCSCPLVDLQ